MDQTIIVSIYSFLVVFGFLIVVAFGLRALFGRGGQSRPNQPLSFALDGMENDVPEWPAKMPQEHLVPPPLPRDDLDYHHAADYVLDPTSHYSIPQPPRCDEGEW